MTTTMRLSAISPDYLLARVECDEARAAFKRAERESGRMEGKNAEHAAEVAAASKSGHPLITNAIAHLRGGGSGFEVVYTACSCTADMECLHDARMPPYSDADIADARQAAAKARKALAAAQKRLVSTQASWDAFASAREANAAYVWWPLTKFTDPRRKRYRGQPVTDAEVEALGPHGLRRSIQAGGILEVPA